LDTPVLRRHARHPRRAASHDSAAIANTMHPMHPMHPSFAAMPDSPGDTQPDSQMHADFAVSSHLSTTGTIHIPLARCHSLFEEEPTGYADNTFEYISSSQNRADAAMTSPTALEDDRAAYTHTAQVHTSPLKFATPAPAGPKRESSDAFSSAARTDPTSTAAFGQAFGASTIGQPLSLTQAFDLTQARTSPVVDGFAEDPVFQRPSPNFTRPGHSSPMAVLSSPTKMMPDDRSDPVARSSSEPRAEYATLGKPHERRKQQAGSRRIQLLQQDSWEEPSPAQKRMQHQNIKDFSHLETDTPSTIPAPIFMSPHSNRQQGGDNPSLSVVNGERQYDGHDSAGELLQPEAVDESDSQESLDESSQEAPGTQDSRVNKVQVPGTSSYRQRTPHEMSSHNPSPQQTPLSPLHRNDPSQTSASQPTNRGIFRPQSSRDSVAVMDSQPDAPDGSQSVPRPKSLRFPSSPSTLQYSINQTTIPTKTGYTSQLVSSSAPPMPPKWSTEQDEDTFKDEGRVPSSPPLLPPDKDIIYDEHTYDEHSEKDEREHDAEPSIVDDDVEMCDDEDLPIAKSEHADEEEDDMDTAEYVVDDAVEQIVDHESGQSISENLPRHQHISQGMPQPAPRLQRQNTIPETDACDETQPSYLSDKRLDSFEHNMRVESQHDTNSIEAPAAVQENQASPSNEQAAAVSRENGSDTIVEGPRIRSLHDIANLPDTQRSAAEEEIEIPRLSGLDEHEDDTFMANSPPRPPTSKKQRTAYDIPTDTCLMKDTTPPMASTQGREEQGALAAAHARETIQHVYGPTATLKKKGVARTGKSKLQRKGALKPVREILDVLSSPITSPSKPKSVATVQAKTPVSPTRPSTAQTDVEMADADNNPDELATSPPPPNFDGAGQDAPARAVTPVGDPLVPNRIFASWPGSHFYPATCIGRSDSRHLQVRFDDGNTTFLDTAQIKALDLRVGDHVKVDESGMKKNTYVVVGLQDKFAQVGGDEYPTSDRYGHMTVILEEKQRDSMPGGAVVKPAASITVPIGSVYLTTQLWTRIRDRTFKFSPLSSPKKSASHMGTPVPTEALHTPSFTRRGTALPSFLKNTTNRASSVASSGTLSSNLFSNMAFVLTSTAEDMDKEAITKVIKANGGRVLEVGFHELFEQESVGKSLSNQGRSKSEPASGDLVLKEEAKQLGFVALITDSHSRSTKYLQALALNVPCLHLRWIEDSLRASCALHFGKYLLPAGVSTYLDPHGVLRSRTMKTYDPTDENVSFEQTVRQRDLLLQNQTVLLVTGKAKKDIERRQPFVFLTHALGSANVGRCADLPAAAQMLQNGHWDWVYVDNGQQGVAEAAAALFGTKVPAKGAKAGKKGKKRKRDSEEKESLTSKGHLDGRDIRVACAEFVIQSLILGALVE
jgi:hypothetical protein